MDEQKRPGRKPRKPAGAMTAAERQRERRIASAERIATGDESTWTDADCLAILTGARWRGGAMDRGAWQRLGQLRGFA
jgi:hypothetical protein